MALHIARGEHRVETITCAIAGARLDLTLYKLVATIALIPGGPVLLQKTSTPAVGITFLDQSAAATKGQATITWTHADTLSLPLGNYYRDVVLYDATNEPQEIIEPELVRIYQPVTVL